MLNKRVFAFVSCIKMPFNNKKDLGSCMKSASCEKKLSLSHFRRFQSRTEKEVVHHSSLPCSNLLLKRIQKEREEERSVPKRKRYFHEGRAQKRNGSIEKALLQVFQNSCSRTCSLIHTSNFICTLKCRSEGMWFNGQLENLQLQICLFSYRVCKSLSKSPTKLPRRSLSPSSMTTLQHDTYIESHVSVHSYILHCSQCCY